MVRSALLIILLLVLPASVWAADACKTVDLRNRFPPIRNQGHRSGWCYAFTAGDLLAEAEGQPPKKPLSIFDVGTTYIAAKENEMESVAKNLVTNYAHVSVGFHASDGVAPGDRKGGFTAKAMLLYLRQNRKCLESSLRSQKGNDESIDLTLEQMENAQSIDLLESHTFIGQRIASLSGRPFPLRPSNTCEAKDYAEEDVIRSLNDLATEKLKNETNGACRSSAPFQKRLQIHEMGYGSVFDTDKATADVNGLLDRGRPIAIAYNFCGLREKRSQSCAHASIIVGRKRNQATGACEVLVRNSHGPYCKQYERMNVRCDTKTPGYFWVDQKILAAQINDLNWVENDPKLFRTPGQGTDRRI